ncbi:MAG: hypothetical protein FWF57_00875 [Defluviitaleaceae bacterium]|nr:hypothetical protein [Defluviitaleaceae bacterium]
MYDYQSEVLGLQALEEDFTEIGAFKSSTPLIIGSSEMCGAAVGTIVVSVVESSLSFRC